MTHPDRRAPRRPAPRGDTVRPSTPRTRTHRVERRPYPTAPTTTRVSPAKPTARTTRARSRGSSSTPTPATVWTAGPVPIDLDATWPIPIITKIVTSFSAPGARVLLLPWPTSQTVTDDTSRLAPVDADGTIRRGVEISPDGDVTAALATIEELNRTGSVARIPARAAVPGPGSRPFWAKLVGEANDSPTTCEQPRDSEPRGEVLDRTPAGTPDSDVVITSLRPEHGGDAVSDLVALVAARRLRVGGVFAVLTHCDWTQGKLIDPSGPMVAAGQNADLLYLQHIVALHTPITNGHLVPDTDGPTAAAEHTLAEHRAAVRRLPAPHRRIHSDVLVFINAQPGSDTRATGARAIR